jgi:putative phosphoesterase
VIVAIISDVHSNVVALEAVLEDIETLGVKRIFCAGDIVGYYPFPNETIDLLKEWNVIAILGNHDRAVIHFNTVGMNRLAADAARWTSENINAENVDYLKSLRSNLRTKINKRTIAMYHGSPRDDDEYLYEIDTGPELIEMCACDFMISGHTHIPFVRKFTNGILINPGSVGQPRDGDRKASYVILDTEHGDVTICRKLYDINKVHRKIISVGLPHFLAERLDYGF